ncbi:MAG TPA: ammonium transporter [Bacteroidales bacterium]|nr:MAG: ammonium transporter [Bacteroidetes bacterium GWE2_42_24]OFY26541.1 MAG: ammonium transporter [Bacteroidetes bacterium GWF2_43_11]HBZ67418.1 ammonium transporter [Bacteroidales bacterium]
MLLQIATIDTGSTGFMLLACSLVMLMTPGLAFFYGGLATKRNILGIMIQSFASLGWTTVLWIAFGYSLCFSGGEGGIIGNFDKFFLNGVSPDSMYTNGKIPEVVFIAYQMMFAIITPALITGAFVNRVTFKSYVIFLTVWQIFVYYPFVHMIWGGGLLAQWGVLDFAGGIVVHATAGFAALASVFYVGDRRVKSSVPNSIPLVAIGSGLLWFGWYGFNAGSEVAVDFITSTAFLNTDVAASFATIAWVVVEWWRERRPKLVGLLTGSIAGLATITPCAGFVPLWAAPIIGTVAGLVCYVAVQFKNKMKWDDALDVWGVHGIGGVLGTILLGVFASTAVNSAGADGLLFGNGSFFIKEVIAVVVASAYAFVFTYLMLALINMITPVRVSESEETEGLDMALHGEKAYDEGTL